MIKKVVSYNIEKWRKLTTIEDIKDKNIKFNQNLMSNSQFGISFSDDNHTHKHEVQALFDQPRITQLLIYFLYKGTTFSAETVSPRTPSFI